MITLLPALAHSGDISNAYQIPAKLFQLNWIHHGANVKLARHTELLRMCHIFTAATRDRFVSSVHQVCS